MTQLDWETSSFNEAQKATLAFPDSKQIVAVSDGYVCSAAVTKRGVSIKTVLEDYAKGYDEGAKGLLVTWKVFAEGHEVHQGRRQF